MQVTDWDRAIAGAVSAAHVWRWIGREDEAARCDRIAAAYRVLRDEGEKR
jgi:hypothetical protein